MVSWSANLGAILNLQQVSRVSDSTRKRSLKWKGTREWSEREKETQAQAKSNKPQRGTTRTAGQEEGKKAQENKFLELTRFSFALDDFLLLLILFVLFFLFCFVFFLFSRLDFLFIFSFQDIFDVFGSSKLDDSKRFNGYFFSRESLREGLMGRQAGGKS